ncbi:MAG: NAD(P)-dependent oxidoreductase [Lachnospiraceae bacterium]|nr:NAD(P)-dependent oxidoreductase [Lachnospiraceae bacterium]
MINYDRKRNPQPTQKPEIRKTNFEEVSGNYTEEQAIAEAMRCFNCRKHPCMDGCPTSQRIPEFIACVAHGDFEAAYEIIRTRSCMPSICGRVCPQERQCEGHCTRGNKGESVKIGTLERFVADWHAKNCRQPDEKPAVNTCGTVAIVGAGPAGLACAESLVSKGYQVTVYDALERPGGVLTYGIPQFRLPGPVVKNLIEDLKTAGVQFCMNTYVGRDITVEGLLSDGFDAVFIGVGAEKRNTLNIPNIDAPGVVSAYDYLAQINASVEGLSEVDPAFKAAKHVVIIGAGNVSMDVSRSAKRLGAERVTIVYRRSVADSTATIDELTQAMEEGVTLCEYAAPAAICVGEDGKVSGIECLKTVPGLPDESGRRSPVPVEGSNFVVEADLIILALGAKPEGSVFGQEEKEMMTNRGVVAATAEGETRHPGVFAGGDAVIGAATVVKAMKGGHVAAESIDEYVRSKCATAS